MFVIRDVNEGMLVNKDRGIIALEGLSLVEADVCTSGTDLEKIVTLGIAKECPSLVENSVDQIVDENVNELSEA